MSHKMDLKKEEGHTSVLFNEDQIQLDYSTMNIKQEPKMIDYYEETSSGLNNIDDEVLTVKQETDEIEIDRNTDESQAHEDESASSSTKKSDLAEELQIKDEITVEEAKVEKYSEFDNIRLQRRCKFCDFRCRGRPSLMAHIRSAHPEDARTRCSVCCFWFKGKSQFEKHIEDKHQGYVYECKICLTKYRKGQYKGHRKECPGRLLFNCDTCDKSYVQKDGLLKHLEEHGVQEDHKVPTISEIMIKEIVSTCFVCKDNRAYRKDAFAKHNKEEHSDYRVWCPHCGKLLSNNSTRWRHLITKRCKGKPPRARLECPECSKSLQNRPALDAHITDIHGKSPYICNVCLKDFRSEGALRYHKRMAHIEPTFSCLLCTHKYHLKRDLRRHMALQHNIAEKVEEQIFECKKCFKQYNHRGNYNQHMKGHKNHSKEDLQVPTSCNMCGIECPSSEAMRYLKIKTHKELRRHMQLQHGTIEEKKSNSCNVCQMDFQTDGALRHHKLMTHIEKVQERIFECEICFNQFNRRGNYNKHMASHHKINEKDKKQRNLRIYECDKCLNQYSNLGAYKAHMKRHENYSKEDLQGPTSCNMCGIECPSYEAMRYHKIKTHKEPSLSCSYCTEKYHFEKELQCHMESQHGTIEEKKSNSCNECGMEFPTSGALRYHKVKSHKEPSLSCSYCKLKFHYKSGLSRHLSTQHNNIKSDREMRHEMCSPKDVESITVDDELNGEIVIKDEITIEEDKIQEFT